MVGYYNRAKKKKGHKVKRIQFWKEIQSKELGWSTRVYQEAVQGLKTCLKPFSRALHLRSGKYIPVYKGPKHGLFTINDKNNKKYIKNIKTLVLEKKK
jgi:hypothetical protein